MGNRCTTIFLRTLLSLCKRSLRLPNSQVYVRGTINDPNIVLAMPSICMKRTGQLMAQLPQLPDVIPIENICHKLKEYL